MYVDGRHLSFSLSSAMGGLGGKNPEGGGPGGQELESRSRHGQAAVLTRQEGARLDNLGGRSSARQPDERTEGAVLDNLSRPGGRKEQCSTTLVGRKELGSTTRDFWR